MQTHWDRFREAVMVLAGSGSIKQRLADAYQAHLHDLMPDDLPRELRAGFVDLVSSLQSGRRTGSLNPVAASVIKMSEAEAAARARQIVALFAALGEEPTGHAASRPVAVLRAVADEDVPAFLNRA
jgi:hypothetical protein